LAFAFIGTDLVLFGGHEGTICTQIIAPSIGLEERKRRDI
jgi:hypothetical protein